MVLLLFTSCREGVFSETRPLDSLDVCRHCYHKSKPTEFARGRYGGETAMARAVKANVASVVRAGEAYHRFRTSNG
jgi:hypothetical protein